MENAKLRAAEIFTNEVVKNLKGIYAIYLFGSVAKGVTAPESDVDVLVVLISKREEAYDALAKAPSAPRANFPSSSAMDLRSSSALFPSSSIELIEGVEASAIISPMSL